MRSTKKIKADEKDERNKDETEARLPEDQTRWCVFDKRIRGVTNRSYLLLDF